MSSDCGSGSGALASCAVRIGITFIAQSACLSFIAVTLLLTHVSYLAFKNRRTPGWRLFRSHLDLYLLGLLFSDLIQSIGGIMDIKWIARAGVFEGHYCIAQGVLEQFGDVGVALCTLAIALHTFAELVLRWKEPASFTIPIVVLSLYTIFLTLIVGVGYAVHRNSVYYGDTVYWCWIKRSFLNEGIGLEYLWLWVAAFASLILYIPIFLTLKGIIVVEPSLRWWGYRVRRMAHDERLVFLRSPGPVNPQRMLFYPAIYIVTVLPIAISRITYLAQGVHVPFPATVFSGILFSASGVFNVIVYTKTRPALLRPSAIIPEITLKPQRRANPRPQLFWTDSDHMKTDDPAGSSVRPDDIPTSGSRDDHRDPDIPNAQADIAQR